MKGGVLGPELVGKVRWTHGLAQHAGWLASIGVVLGDDEYHAESLFFIWFPEIVSDLLVIEALIAKMRHTADWIDEQKRLPS